MNLPARDRGARAPGGAVFGRGRSPAGWGVSVGLCLALTAGGLLGCGRSVAPSAPPPAVAPPAPAQGPAASAPRTPALSLPVLTLEGEAVELAEQVKFPAVLFYFSASCPHCLAVAPEVASLSPRLASLGWSMVGVASGSNRLGQLEEFASTTGVGFPILLDFTRRFASGNDMMGTPSALILDGQGRLIEEHYPYHPGSGLAVEMTARRLAGGDPFAAFEPGRYQGTRACGSCHPVELRSWALTHHSVAYQTVYSRERHTDPECVGCHVTGWERPTGYSSLERSAGLVDVGCESCHGPGGVHGARNAGPGDPWLPPLDYAAVCAGCHDAKHSVAFDYARALPHIDHAAAATLSDAEFDARLESLASGRAERPMLAFPEGRHLGAAACASCHPEQHAQWGSSPHGRAIASLEAKGAQEQVACLACHALPMRKPAEKAAHFQPGVSCEQCHGPGEKHVASGGGPGTILGLGDSCPVCVVEEICTRCHTPEMDPDWDLDAMLPRVAHRQADAPPSGP